MNQYLLNLDDINLSRNLKYLDENFENKISTIIYNLSISKLYEIKFLDNDEYLNLKIYGSINESFSEFKLKIENKLANVESSVKKKVENIIGNIKLFVKAITVLFIDILNYGWSKIKGNSSIYIDNLYKAVKGVKGIKSKGFKEEAIWYKKTAIWFEKDFFPFLSTLVEACLNNDIIESIKNDYNILTNFSEDTNWLNEAKELVLSAAEEEDIFYKFHNEIKNSKEYKILKSTSEFLISTVNKLKEGIVSKIEKDLYWFALKLEKFPKAPRAPSGFETTEFIVTTAIDLGIWENTGIGTDIVNWKVLGMYFLKKFLHIFLLGIVPEVDIIWMILNLKHFFIVVGAVIEKLSVKE